MKKVVLLAVFGSLSLVMVEAKEKRYEKTETQQMSSADGKSSFQSISHSYSSSMILDAAYKDISGHIIPEEERAKKKKEMLKESEIVYGEIKHDAVKDLLKELKLTEQDVVYDLGSGVGKFCYQVAIDSPAKKVVGVELCPTRHMNAQKALTLMEDNVRIAIENRVFFKEADFLKTDVSDATVVFLCSTCYSTELMEKLVYRLAECKKGLRVLSLNELPKHKNFSLIKILPSLSMSWGKHDVYLYELGRTKDDVKDFDLMQKVNLVLEDREKEEEKIAKKEQEKEAKVLKKEQEKKERETKRREKAEKKKSKKESTKHKDSIEEFFK